MGRGINVDVRAEKYVVSDMNLRPVQNRAAEVGKEVIANMNVVPVITVKRCDDSQVVPMSAQQAGYDSFLSFPIRWCRLVVFIQNFRPASFAFLSSWRLLSRFFVYNAITEVFNLLIKFFFKN